MVAGNNKIAHAEKIPLKEYCIKVQKIIASILMIALFSFVARTVICTKCGRHYRRALS